MQASCSEKRLWEGVEAPEKPVSFILLFAKWKINCHAHVYFHFHTAVLCVTLNDLSLIKIEHGY